ncbi:beta-catenin family protein [Cyclospora cayetanensis]|uniref:Beta-catenin family protein n=1 Tax=Cyclospora cayetanensis TaxID=88456 RepID=A0A1D3DAV3_9EIME|nr:beta-catenin family protein [Cyclospora cayetanensis]
MELEEIIKPYSLAPERNTTRPASDNPQGIPSSAKRHQVDPNALSGEAGGVQGKVSLEDLPDEIDTSAVEKILEQADEVHVEEITEASIRRCAAQLERRVKKNQHDRIKFASNPEKCVLGWIKSEVDLDEEVKRWTQVAADPSLFPLLFESGAFEVLTSLLSHANTDLAVDVVEVFSELTEADSVMEAPDPQAVVDQLVGSHLPEMVVDLLCRLKEDGSEDDALGISSCLSVVENLLELQPSLATTFAQAQKLPAFLFKRIRPPPVAAAGSAGAVGGTAGGGGRVGVSAYVTDGTRLHAAEVLASLLQQLQPQEKTQLGGRTGGDGVDRLLRAVAPYRKKDPESAQEVSSKSIRSLKEELEIWNSGGEARGRGDAGGCWALEGRPRCHTIYLRVFRLCMTRIPQVLCLLPQEELVLNLFDALCSLLLVESNRELLGKQQGVELMLRIIKERRFFTPQAVKALDFALMDSPANCATFVERLGLRFLFSMFLGKVKEGGHKPKKPDDLIEHVVSLINSLLKNCTGTPIGVDPEERRYLDACEAGLSVLQQIDCIIVRLTNAGNAMASSTPFSSQSSFL